jgi:hypothetical protein
MHTLSFLQRVDTLILVYIKVPISKKKEKHVKPKNQTFIEFTTTKRNNGFGHYHSSIE